MFNKIDLPKRILTIFKVTSFSPVSYSTSIVLSPENNQNIIIIISIVHSSRYFLLVPVLPGLPLFLLIPFFPLSLPPYPPVLLPLLGPLHQNPQKLLLANLAIAILINLLKNLPNFLLTVLFVLQKSGYFIIGDDA
jgi:hypothetical protein